MHTRWTLLCIAHDVLARWDFFLPPSLSVIRDQNLHGTVSGLISLDALDRSKNESPAVLLPRHSFIILLE